MTKEHLPSVDLLLAEVRPVFLNLLKFILEQGNNDRSWCGVSTYSPPHPDDSFRCLAGESPGKIKNNRR